jgi:hypothetical protein
MRRQMVLQSLGKRNQDGIPRLPYCRDGGFFENAKSHVEVAIYLESLPSTLV